MPIAPALPTQLRPFVQACVLAVGLFALALPAAAGDYEEANRLFKAGQHAKALEQIDQHLANKPKDPQGRFLKGIILTGLNRTGEAQAVFRKLTEDYPELPEPYNNLAVIYAQQKQYDKAKEALEMAIRTHPAYATAHENLGDIYSRLASQAYGKALQIDAANTSAQTKLAMINELVGTAAAKPAPAGARTVAIAMAGNEKTPAIAKAPLPPPPAAEPPAKVPEVQPATPPAKPVAAAGDEASIAAAVDAWLAAWSKKDVKAYLASYAKDFETPKGQSRQAWDAERAQRIGKPGKIEVGRDKLAVRSEGADRAIVSFRQSYRSANFKSASGKMLVMVKRDGKWLIQQERVGSR